MLAALCLAATTLSAAAHPHVFIAYAATILCQNDKIVGVRFAWTFDEMYSASLFNDYTGRPKGALTPADIQKLHDEAFKDSAEEHYFAEIAFNGKSIPLARVTDFGAAYDGRKMTYRFTVPLDLAPAHGENVLDVGVFDHEFYIDFEPVKHDPVAVEHGGAIKLACAPATVTKDTTTFGPLKAQILRCHFTGAV